MIHLHLYIITNINVFNWYIIKKRDITKEKNCSLKFSIYVIKRRDQKAFYYYFFVFFHEYLQNILWITYLYMCIMTPIQLSSPVCLMSHTHTLSLILYFIRMSLISSLFLLSFFVNCRLVTIWPLPLTNQLFPPLLSSFVLK